MTAYKEYLLLLFSLHLNQQADSVNLQLTDARVKIKLVLVHLS